ncbi:hypothetical protein V1511DRAFT_516775 [Dipodascopsis uninucleata]
MQTNKLLLLLLIGASSVLGHFNLNYPTSRGSNHDTQTEAPCGGINTVSKNLTLFNPDGSPIATTSSHSESGVAVYFCPKESGCDSNADFNVTLVPIFLETGAGAFCLPSVQFPNSIYPAHGNSTLVGTIQVRYESDDGELYNCADVEVSRAGIQSSSMCTNATGISTSTWTGSLDDDDSNNNSSSSSSDSSSAASSSAVVSMAFVAAMVGAISLLI